MRGGEEEGNLIFKRRKSLEREPAETRSLDECLEPSSSGGMASTGMHTGCIVNLLGVGNRLTNLFRLVYGVAEFCSPFCLLAEYLVYLLWVWYGVMVHRCIMAAGIKCWYKLLVCMVGLASSLRLIAGAGMAAPVLRSGW